MTLDEAIRHCEEVANDKAGCCEDCADEHRQFAEWLKQVPRWVAVKNRLPEDSGEYLVYIVANNEPKNKSIITLYYTNLSKRFVYYDNDNLFTITHWCYLPEPPKEYTEGMNMIPERCPICGKPIGKDGSWYYCTDEECEYVWNEDNNVIELSEPPKE